MKLFPIRGRFALLCFLATLMRTTGESQSASAGNGGFAPDAAAVGNGRGTGEVFRFVFSDPQGYADIAT